MSLILAFQGKIHEQYLREQKSQFLLKNVIPFGSATETNTNVKKTELLKTHSSNSNGSTCFLIRTTFCIQQILETQLECIFQVARNQNSGKQPKFGAEIVYVTSVALISYFVLYRNIAAGTV